jgi:hypothetical protein
MSLRAACAEETCRFDLADAAVTDARQVTWPHR